MKKTITYELAKELGLIEDPYRKRSERFYEGSYPFEGFHYAEQRRNTAEIGAKSEAESHMMLPNCVDKELYLFEFEEDVIKKAVKSLSHDV